MLMQSFLLGLIICFGTFYAIFLWTRRRLYYLAEKIPGPKGLPFIGMAHKFINASCKEMFDIIMPMPLGYTTIMKVWLGPELVVFASTPESLQIVLNSQKCIEKSPLYDCLLLKKGLVIAKAQMWKLHRKILNPAFNIGVLQEFIPIFDKKSRIFGKNLEQKIGKGEFDVFHYISACSLETLFKTMMGLDRDIQSDPLGNDYIHHTEVCARILATKMLNIFYHYEPIYRLTRWKKLEQKHFHEGMLKIADEIREERAGMNDLEMDQYQGINDGYTSRKPKTFINILLKAQNILSNEEINDEINTLVAAGHESSALVISSTLLMLAMHPEVQEKVKEELKEVYGSADTSIDYESINQLIYLDMVIKEAMRLFPVVPVSARKASDEIEIGDHTIPAGATIVIPVFTVQRNKLYWGKDADKFRPERFEPESFKKVHPYAFIPFTGGPRICIGWRYGMLFMKSVLANFLRHYEVDTTQKYEDLTFEITLALNIVQRFMISVKKRNF